jgi:small subunit ribosomal protein S20
VNQLANIKSAKKRILVAAKRQARNRHVKSSTKTAIKKLTLAASAGQKENLQALFTQAVSAIDKAASKGVYHKNTASRKKSQLAKLMNKAV